MKVLWFVNICFPEVSKDFGLPEINKGGWLLGLKNSLIEVDDLELIIGFPVLKLSGLKKIEKNNCIFYGVPSNGMSNNVDLSMKDYLKKMLLNEKPDLIHIHGTEFPHTFLLTEVCKELNIVDKVVISIQGLVSIYSKHLIANLPSYVLKRKTLIDYKNKTGIKDLIKNFEKRGELEKKSIYNVNHVIGRTDWDKACSKIINPKVNYHFCNETLRSIFYEKKWSWDNCEKFSIFMSQANTPIKGLHFLLEALPIVLKEYPDTKVYIAGGNLVGNGTFMDNIKLTSYQKYIKSLINKYQLNDKIIFTGNLTEEEMCSRFLRSNVFVSPSSIENSPNSVGEAMLLGVPVISSDVGGVKNMMIHNEEGFIYQHDAYYMLAYYIMEVFSNRKLAESFSKTSIEKAKITHNKEINVNKMVTIYNEIANTKIS